MNKLQQLIAWLTPSMIHEGKSYVYFQDKTGEPTTVIEQDGKLILSGNKPGGPIHRFDEVNVCLRYVIKTAPKDLWAVQR